MILTVTIGGATARIPYSIEPRRVNVGGAWTAGVAIDAQAFVDAFPDADDEICDCIEYAANESQAYSADRPDLGASYSFDHHVGAIADAPLHSSRWSL